jgi:hypothetical protein
VFDSGTKWGDDKGVGTNANDADFVVDVDCETG